MSDPTHSQPKSQKWQLGSFNKCYQAVRERDAGISVTTLNVMLKVAYRQGRAKELSFFRFVETALIEEKLSAQAKEASNASQQVPSSFLLALLLSSDVSPDVIANMEEVYREIWAPRYGTRKARIIWWSQTAQLIGRRWLSPLLDTADKIRKIVGI